MLYSEIQISLLLKTKIKAQITIYSLIPYLLISFFIFLTCCLIGDDWNQIMEHETSSKGGD